MNVLSLACGKLHCSSRSAYSPAGLDRKRSCTVNTNNSAIVYVGNGSYKLTRSGLLSLNWTPSNPTPSFLHSSSSMRKICSMKKYCSCSLATLMHICSKPFCSNFSKPKMSRMPISVSPIMSAAVGASNWFTLFTIQRNTRSYRDFATASRAAAVKILL